MSEEIETTTNNSGKFVEHRWVNGGFPPVKISIGDEFEVDLPDGMGGTVKVNGVERPVRSFSVHWSVEGPATVKLEFMPVGKR